MRTYIRKTVDEYRIYQLGAEGWEEVTCETTWKEGRARLKEYRENQPEIPAKMEKHRVRIEA